MLNKIYHKLNNQKKHTNNSAAVSLRSEDSERVYLAAKLTGFTKPLLEEDRLRQWKFWAVIENAFPYDMTFKVHHLLIPLRITSEKDLLAPEREELKAILDDISSVYDCYLANFISKQSIKDHYHIHLLTYKDSRKEYIY